MKKLLALILSILMLVSFAACGSSDSDDDVRGDLTDDTSSTNSTDSNDSDLDVEDNNSSNSEEFSFGNATGKKYENEYLGIGCELDSEWTFYTDEQIAELNNITTSNLDEVTAEAIENANVIYDMYAITAKQDTINVNLEKMSGFGASVIDVDTYIDTALPQLKDAMAQMGVTVVKCEKTSLSFAGQTVGGIAMEISANGVSAYQKMACIKKGKYIAIIGVATYNTDNTDSLLSKFYSLDN